MRPRIIFGVWSVLLGCATVVSAAPPPGVPLPDAQAHPGNNMTCYPPQGIRADHLLNYDEIGYDMLMRCMKRYYLHVVHANNKIDEYYNTANSEFLKDTLHIQFGDCPRPIKCPSLFGPGDFGNLVGSCQKASAFDPNYYFAGGKYVHTVDSRNPPSYFCGWWTVSLVVDQPWPNGTKTVRQADGTTGPALVTCGPDTGAPSTAHPGLCSAIV